MSKTFFSEEEQQRIVEAIKQAELNTSGEVRVHIEAKCKGGDPFNRGLEVFEMLGMHATSLRNGVLIYLAYRDKKFAILGDQGIHAKVSQSFWNSTKELMQSHFKQLEFTEGLCKGIEQAGEKLKQHFPFQQNDTNELSNDISFGGGENE